MSAEAAKVLNDAADYLVEHGWIQRESGNKAGSCCALGAISMVIFGDPRAWIKIDYMPVMQVASLLDPYIAESGVVSWNDADGRTADEVIAKLREVADAEEAKP